MARHIKNPLLILQAGDDKVVSNCDQLKFYNKVIKNNHDCVLKVIENSRHEILFEKDEYRNQALDSILSFYRRY